VLRLLESLAIPVDKDLEVVEYGPADDGRRLYGAWFYLVGALVSEDGHDAGDEFENVGQGVSFRISGQTVFIPPAWKGLPLLLVEVNFSLPWVLPELPD